MHVRSESCACRLTIATCGTGPPAGLPRAWLLEELKCLWYVTLVKWRIEEEFEMNYVAGKAGSESHWYCKGSCMYWAVPLCSGE